MTDLDLQNPYEVTTEDKVTAAKPPPAQLSLTDCLACSGCVTSAEAMLVSLQSHTEVLTTLDTYPELALPSPAGKGYVNGAGNGVANGVHHHGLNGAVNGTAAAAGDEGKIFFASISPQARASLAATFGVSEREAGHMVERVLSGPDGVRRGGAHGSGFAWVIDTNTVREAALVLAADEVAAALSGTGPSPVAPGDEGAASTVPKKPILTSACPGWICYAEKTHPYVLPHLSRMKSPQALAGTLVKSVLWRRFGIAPERVWHLAVMPCFDKKLEASRSELTSAAWMPPSSSTPDEPVRDVDCVITARELLSLAQSRGIDFASIPRKPLPRAQRARFPDPELDAFLFPSPRRTSSSQKNNTPTAAAADPFAVGTSGGYLYHIMQTFAARQHPARPTSLHVERGRNADVVEYLLKDAATGEVLVKTARFYGFRNIQNLVRRLKPARASRMPGARTGVARRPGGAKGGAGAAGGGGDEYAYVEVMACPGGCTNGGGQIKVEEVAEVRGEVDDEGVVMAEGGEVQQQKKKPGPLEQKEWLRKVDEAYFSASSSEDEDEAVDAADRMMDLDVNGVDDGLGGEAMDVDPALPETNGVDEEDVVVDGVSRKKIHAFLRHWSDVTGVDVADLTQTSYRKVESDVGKAKKASDVERVAGLASSIGGGW
ncbi:putative iron-sulfur cluster assembly associated protein nar1 [Diplodia seriata]|uniref:Nuclear architecture-related protein 1 n=1 Tax=Diplodia seriata TaxID=420778 RepID=A0A0G2ENU7_9PEZI|nr:putative iron-sulfur cluster assembly associated protein nar1 [Diplodia seriata]